ncbi:MAG TPA: hypothetical protein PLS60_09875, partial [Arenimonas sp.]|nr:hypothetical protein [Arenimonas sp.]
MKNSNSILRPFLFAMLLGTVAISGCKGGKETDSDAKSGDQAKTEQADPAAKDGKEGEKKPEAVLV